MRLLKTPLVVTLRAIYWVPVGLIVLPARDAVAVVGESVGTIVRELTVSLRRHG